MNTLLLFFALPVATFILAVVLEKILRCPFLTAATFFAIFLIVAFAVFDATFLVFVIVYTVISFIAAVIAEFFFRRFCCNKTRRCISECLCQRDYDEDNSNSENTIRLSNRDINAIARQVANIQSNANNCGCSGNGSNQLDTVNVNVRDSQTGNRTSWCCYRR